MTSPEANEIPRERTLDGIVDRWLRYWFPLRLKELRLARGWTQHQLALRAGLAVSTINELEGGQMTGVDFRTVGKLAIALEVTLDELAGHNGAPPPGFPKANRTPKISVVP
jgi:transcriptional regulator with XRE-family HTH domain